MEVQDLINSMRDFDPERLLGLRAPYPPIALELDHDEMVLVRLKPARRGAATLEAQVVRPSVERTLPTSMFQGASVPIEDLSARLLELFEVSGTKPGRVSLVLPDNLARISMLRLPERPASRRQLGELVQAKMRRAVPFRLEEAVVSYQLLPGEGKGVSILAVVVRRLFVEVYERALERIGVRTGSIDVVTPNLINLYSEKLAAASVADGDAGLINCTPQYFSLVIVRGGKLIFFRCKPFSFGDANAENPGHHLYREVANSFSYYREKLEGSGVKTLFVRSTAEPPDQIADQLRALGCETVETLDPLGGLELGEGVSIDPVRAQRVAPAIAAGTRGT